MISLLVGSKDDQERKRECGEYIYLVGEMIKRGKESVESSWWERMQCKRVKES